MKIVVGIILSVSWIRHHRLEAHTIKGAGLSAASTTEVDLVAEAEGCEEADAYRILPSVPHRPGPWRQTPGRQMACGTPQTGVMPTAGSPFSISNWCLACCGLGPRLSIIQELGSICCLVQDLLLFNSTKPWWIRFNTQGGQVSRGGRTTYGGPVAAGRGPVQTASRVHGRREEKHTHTTRDE